MAEWLQIVAQNEKCSKKLLTNSGKTHILA